MSDLLASILGRYAAYSMIGDGLPEINSFTYMAFENEYSEVPADGRLALVLVEPRLLDTAGHPDLSPAFLNRLQRFKGDLRAEGLYTRFIITDIYRGPVHKDGQIVLALRQFFREVKSFFTRFEGAILIGNFPEATLVRTVAWSPGWLPGGLGLAIGTELISERADIVLADLTGNWENIYRQNDFSIEAITAYPDAATTARGWNDGETIRTCEFTSENFTVAPGVNFRDAFYIDDAIYTILENRTFPGPFLRISLNQAERNNEVDVTDRSMVNIIAKPDINVSRINPYHVAVNPNPLLQGTDGTAFLDAAGNPQLVNSPTPLFDENNEHVELFSFKDFDLERRLLIGYFDRNHRFRNGAFSHLPFRGAVVSGTTDFHPDWYEGLVNAAATDFQPCVKTSNASLQQYVQFHKEPAVLKYIIAHSDPVISQFNGSYDPVALATEAGGPPLRWVYSSGQYVPGFERQGINADLYLHRTLWHYNTLQNAGASLIIHGGCNVNSVYETQTDTYVSQRYAHWNNAEGILFYTNCVSIFSRAKGFNDAPNGFTDGYRLTDRANFGSCWRSYFLAQTNDGSINTYNIQRKRAYFWSINGDWTLRLRNKNGLGILSLNGTLGSVEVHPNRAWIEGWNYDAAVNYIRGIGDMDGDGIDEFIISSDWGVGVLKYNGFHFRALMVAPRDTWFGGWRWDATINTGRDRIMDVANFTGTSNSEILVWSSWGIATLQYDGTSLVSSRIHANGTRLGGWIINTSDNIYCGNGRFGMDAVNDMIVMSPWGLGIISLQNNADVYMAPNGTRFGGWLLNSADNTIRLVADLDGDGMDEILISSPWGIGILKLQDGALTSIAMHANGENLGGYIVNNAHVFAVADNLGSGAGKQLLLTDETGMHLLALVGNSLMRQAFAAHGVRIDGWIVDTGNNRLQPAGDMNADGRAEFVIRSPWGVGIMGIDTANNFRCYSLYPYNSVLDDWHLEGGDMLVGIGNLAGSADRKMLLIVKP